MLWRTGFADVDASSGADGRARWMGTENGVTEVEHAGFDGFGLAVIELFGGRPGADCGFGTGVAGAVAVVGYAW